MGKHLANFAAGARHAAPAWLALAMLLAAPVLPAKSHFIVIGGLGGQPAYERQFADQVEKLSAVLTETAGREGSIRVLLGAQANKNAITAALNEVAAEATEADSLSLFLIGHGTWDGRNYKFNITGPDITGTDLKRLLDGVPASRQFVAALTSASGELSKALKKDGLVLLTATRSGRERNVVQFPAYYIEALTSAEADVDKSETVNAEEAFRLAEARTKSSYEDANKMQNEHAVLTGDGAAAFVLARSGIAAAAASNPELAAQISKREEIERQIQELRGRRAELGDDAYFDRLEELLTELANVQTDIEEKASPK